MTALHRLRNKQVWLQMLAVVHLRPQRVILLRSEDMAASQALAQRLRKCFGTFSKRSRARAAAAVEHLDVLKTNTMMFT